MKDINELLKSLKKEPIDLGNTENVEKITERTIKPGYFTDFKTDSVVNRMLPSCYSTINTPNVGVDSFNEETLFYIFYAMNGTEMQVEAFNTILDRGYLYSTQLEKFIIINQKPMADNIKQTILAFDPFKWEKENIEIEFTDSFLNTIISEKIPSNK